MTLPAKKTPLKIYAAYRLLLSILLFGIGFTVLNKSGGRFIPDLYYSVSITYIFIACITFFLTYQSHLESNIFKFTTVACDILIITILAHATGGLISNLSILLVVAVAAGGIMIVGRPATLLAAIATLAVLFEQIYYTLVFNTRHLLTSAGFLGIAFFAVSILSQVIARQLRESEARASKSEESLAEWRELSHMIVQRMRTGILVLSRSGHIQLINEASKKLLNIPDMPLLGQPLINTSPFLYQHFHDWTINQTNTTQPFRSSDNGPAIHCDFTELIEKHTDRQVLVFLEDATTLTQQAQHLKLTSLATLTAGIAHEIRNPLGAISHAAQLLLESDDLSTGDHKLANIVQQHSVRMNNIIENVLYLSRRKKPSPKRFQLDVWLHSFLSEFKESYKKECRLTLISQSDNILVNTDQSQIGQVLTNLIENGLRYSLKEISQAKVDIITTLSEEELPVLKVKDYGPGISEEHINKLFEPFFTSETNGTGLGLYLARELCEINHAHLSLVPMDEQGCCFQITFPHPRKRIFEEDISL